MSAFDDIPTDPEEREQAIHSSRFDIEVDTEQYSRRNAVPPRWRDESSPRSRSPSPDRDRGISPLRPPAPPAYNQNPFAEADIPVILDETLIQRTSNEEEDEENRRWVPLLRKTGYKPSPDDIDFSDDEYENDEEERRKRRKIPDPPSTLGETVRQRLLRHLESYPEIAQQPGMDDIRTLLSRTTLGRDEEMEVERRTPDQLIDLDEAWNEYWRLKDRKWCFMCAYRRSVAEQDYIADYREMLEYIYDMHHGHDLEHTIRTLQDIFFARIRDRLPKRGKCHRTGRQKPPHYYHRAMIRVHLTQHIHLPIHTEVDMCRQWKRASFMLKTAIFTEMADMPNRYKYERQVLNDAMKVDQWIVKLNDSIQARLSTTMHR
jgi:hypothetical protein